MWPLKVGSASLPMWDGKISTYAWNVPNTPVLPLHAATMCCSQRV
jgi:hypothetical protein